MQARIRRRRPHNHIWVAPGRPLPRHQCTLSSGSGRSHHRLAATLAAGCCVLLSAPHYGWARLALLGPAGTSNDCGTRSSTPGVPAQRLRLF
jgi:hypothetical protein